MTRALMTAVLEAVERLPAGVVEELARAVLLAGSPRSADRVCEAAPQADFRRL